MQGEIVLEKKVRKIMMPAKVKGEGAPIVLVPGGLTGWESWDRAFEVLAASRKAVSVQLLSVDLRSNKEPLPEGYSVGMESRALKNTLDELSLSQPLDIAAWSYGAEIALDFALGNPERVRTLTLIEPLALWVLGDKNPLGIDYEALKALSGSMSGNEVSGTQLEQALCSIALCPPDTSSSERPQWPSWFAHRFTLLNIYAALGHNDDVVRLHGFNRPVLIVKGEGSDPFLHQIADALSSELPRAELFLLPSGHAPHLVSPKNFLDQMAAFQKAADMWDFR